MKKSFFFLIMLIISIFATHSQDAEYSESLDSKTEEKQKEIVIIENESEWDIELDQYRISTENEFTMPLSYPVTKAIADEVGIGIILFFPVLIPLTIVPLDCSVIQYDGTTYFGFLYHFYFPIAGAEHLAKLYTRFDVDLCPFKNLAAGVSADLGITIGRKVAKLNLGLTGGYFKNDWFGGYKISTSFGEECGMKFSFMNGKTLNGSNIMKFDFGFKFLGFD